MGWFSSLIDSASNVIGKIVSNAGPIVSAVSAVGKVAGLVLAADAKGKPLEDTQDDLGDPLITLHTYYGKASKVITERAESFDPNTDASPDHHGVVHKATVNGLWFRPSTTMDGQPSLPMYQDLSKFLAFHQMPLTLEGKYGTKFDTAEVLAGPLFANAPAPYAQWSKLHAEGAFPGHEVQTEVSSGAGDCRIIAKHVYYDVPLGEAANDSAWHGAVHVQMTSTKEFLEKHKAKIAKTALLNRKVTAAAGEKAQMGTSDGPRWCVTIRIEWTTALFAGKMSVKFSKSWSGANPGYPLLMNSCVGSSQNLKVLAPMNVPPAMVKQAVTTFCSYLLGGGGSLNAHTALLATTTLPTIEVTNASITL